MASAFSIRGLFARRPTLTTLGLGPLSSRLFSTTEAMSARAGGGSSGGGSSSSAAAAKRRKHQPIRSENHGRIKILKQNMFTRAPPPLRMARLRHLRHWTIHRAWQLFRRQQHAATDAERQRMHAGMFNACEELRATVGPAARGEGYLYRVAMEKKGVHGLAAIPIEYARLQTDSPATQAWNHDWKR
ncbi:hypothetical protein HIM_07322 [Hirsutella minnesotensis 3608]|uniref:Uncharacterized protein n=1 Tax=Hirsutella minnesotensis 3608 TaxID=1043627 RepID=A0A0F7ZTL4_9HYPO|nr:hypothetical protein HIM_07322 [Hirsutella minnesotensis 3608]